MSDNREARKMYYLIQRKAEWMAYMGGALYGSKDEFQKGRAAAFLQCSEKLTNLLNGDYDYQFDTAERKKEED